MTASRPDVNTLRRKAIACEGNLCVQPGSFEFAVASAGIVVGVFAAAPATWSRCSNRLPVAET